MALTNKLTELANAIRSKTGGSALMTIDEMIAAVNGISGGGFDYSGITGGIGFRDATDQTTIDLSTLDTSNFTNLSSMFTGCEHLTSLDVTGLDTSNVTNMSGMFNKCSGLSSLDVTHFDTSNVTNMGSMFYGCGMATIDLTHFDTSSLDTMGSMFYNSSFTSLDLRSFDTSNVTTFYCLFRGCSRLKSIYFPNVTTSTTMNVQYMFTDCSQLEALIWGTNKTSVVALPSTLSKVGMSLNTHLYVPDDLVSSYQTATNWSSMSSRIHGVSDLPQVYKDLYGIE